MPRHILALAFILQSIAIVSAAAETIKIAQIDPMSGPFGLVGESLGRHLDAAADEINAKGGVLEGAKFEVWHVDNKGRAPESGLLLNKIIDSGIRCIRFKQPHHY